MGIQSLSKKLDLNLEVQNAARTTALQSFLKRGWPTRKNEAWKYTNLKQISEQYIAENIALTSESALISESDLASIKNRLQSEHLNLVFVNGFFQSELSSIDAIQKFNIVLDINEAEEMIRDDSKGMDSHLEDLGRMVAQSTFKIEINQGVEVLQPLHISNFATSHQAISALRVLVILREGSIASFIEESANLDSHAKIVTQNTFARFELMQDAKLQYLRLQSNNINTCNLGRTEFNLADRVQLDSLVLHLGAKLSRHELLVHLKGREARANFLGGLLVDGDRHVDNFTQIQHHCGENSTDQLYKGIVNDQAKSIFRGLVYIAQNAQKSNSNQLNNNLLLSSQAEAISLPQLQIYADDVKATHGATIGELDEEEIFYFQSRAIHKEKAIQLLAVGFLNEVVYRLNDVFLQKYSLRQIEVAMQNLKRMS